MPATPALAIAREGHSLCTMVLSNLRKGPVVNLNRTIVAAQFPALPSDGLSALCVAADKWEIDSALRQAIWIAQMAVESGGFKHTRESLNYRADKLVPQFGKSRISHTQAAAFGRIDNKQVANQQALANILYGGAWGKENLGNIELGDGWLFIGRGYIQITGRYNYRVISNLMFGDSRLLDDPKLLEQPEHAAMAGGAYWCMKHLNELADTGSVRAVTAKVNVALLELAARTDWATRLLPLFTNAPADFSQVVGGSSTTEI